MDTPQSIDNSVIKRIQALLAKRDGLAEMIAKSTPEESLHLQNEMEVAAAKAFQLLKQHQLTEGYIKNFDFSPKNINTSIFNPAEYGLEVLKTLPKHHMILATLICKHFSLQVMTISKPSDGTIIGNCLMFVGYEVDRKAGIMMYAYLLKELTEYSEVYYKLQQEKHDNFANIINNQIALMLLTGKALSNPVPPKDVFMLNWYSGCIRRLSERFVAERDTVIKLQGSTALTFEKNKEAATEQFVKDMLAKIGRQDAIGNGEELARKMRDEMPFDAAAYGSGYVHGNSMKLNNNKEIEI